MDVLTRLMAVQTIPYMSMSVGMMAQNWLLKIAHDKDLQTCAKDMQAILDFRR